MADLRATEMFHGRTHDPPDYVDSTPAPVMYTRYVNHGPAVPTPYDAPPLPPYDPPYAPRHFLPPYEYRPEPTAHMPPRGQEIPPDDFRGNVPAIPPPLRGIPHHDPPADIVIPGVQHPNGRFEPHPYFANRSAPAPPVESEEPEEPSKKTVEVAVPVCCEECRELITNYVGEIPDTQFQRQLRRHTLQRVDLGTSDPVALDVLINATVGVNSDHVGIKQLVFGGQKLGDWEEGMINPKDCYKSYKI